MKDLFGKGFFGKKISASIVLGSFILPENFFGGIQKINKLNKWEDLQ